MNGSTLWSSPLPEEAQDVTCLDLIPGSVAKTICLVTGTRKMLSAFNATSGKEWPWARRVLPPEPQCRIRAADRGNCFALLVQKVLGY